MFPLFETIKIHDGKIFNLKWHQWRFEQSCKSYFDKMAYFKLADVISLPDKVKTGLFKLRFSYNPDHFKLQFDPYIYKKISYIKVIHCDNIEYTFKYSNRNQLDKLLAQQGNCDDILIVKNDLITDTSFANIVFFDGNKWITPKKPLLKGTCRERLLYEKKISEADIKKDNLHKYQFFKLINAMRDFDNGESLPVKNIYFSSK